MTYAHLVEYEPETDKIVIYRMPEPGSGLSPLGPKLLYTEIKLAKVGKERMTGDRVVRALGEALIVDIKQLRERFM
jgi:hypothetical protein